MAVNDDTDYDDYDPMTDGIDETLEAEGHEYSKDEDGNYSRIDEEGGQWYTNERPEDEDDAGGWTEGLTNEEIEKGLAERGLTHDTDENGNQYIRDLTFEEQYNQPVEEEEAVNKDATQKAAQAQIDRVREEQRKQASALDKAKNALNVAFGGYDRWTGQNKIGETVAQATNNGEDRAGKYGEALDRLRNIGYGLMTDNGKYWDDINEDKHLDWYEGILGHGLKTSTDILNKYSPSGSLGDTAFDIYSTWRGNRDTGDLSKTQQTISDILGEAVSTGISLFDPVSKGLNFINDKTMKYDEDGNPIGGKIDQLFADYPILGQVSSLASNGISNIGGKTASKGIEALMRYANNHPVQSTADFSHNQETDSDYAADIVIDEEKPKKKQEVIKNDLAKSTEDFISKNKETAVKMGKKLLQGFDDKKREYISKHGWQQNTNTSISDERLKAYVVANIFDNEAMRKIAATQILMDYFKR